MKDRKITSLLAFIGGSIGAHRFYLEQKILGFSYIIGFAALFILSIEANAPFLFIAFIVGFLDGLLFAVMHPDEFDLKYNNALPIRNKVVTQEIQQIEETPLEELLVDNHTKDELSISNSKVNDLLEQLNRIKTLKEEGILTNEEVEILKNKYM